MSASPKPQKIGGTSLDGQEIDQLPPIDTAAPQPHRADQVIVNTASGTAKNPLEPLSPLNYPPRPNEQGVGMLVVRGTKFIQAGVSYLALKEAAALASTSVLTLKGWIRHRKEFDGHPLETLQSPFVNRVFISEESTRRVANRFVKWPSGKPAGRIRLGVTSDHSSYIGLPEAAAALHLSDATLRFWITHDSAPIGRPLEAVRCTASSHLYILQSEIYALHTILGRKRALGPSPGRRLKARATPPRLVL